MRAARSRRRAAPSRALLGQKVRRDANRKGRGSEKAHRGASAATHLAAVTPVACMASGGAPSGVRARAKVATTRSTRRTREVECRARAARLLGDLNAAELRNRENDDYDVE